MSEFTDACRRYQAKLDTLAAKYVERGYAPWEAIEKAQKDIRRQGLQPEQSALSEYLRELFKAKAGDSP